MSRVVIVGAGISGLACAHRLAALARERGGAPAEVVLLEAASRPGGAIATTTAGGYLMEAGPDCFITDRPWAIDLCRRLGLGEEILGTNPRCRRSFIVKRGRLLPIPEGFYLLAPARALPFLVSPVLSPLGRLRVGCEVLLPRGAPREDESLASFVRRRFGKEALERLAHPLVAGIYGADPEALSLRATFPLFLELERSDRSVILGLRRRQREAAAGRAAGGAGTAVAATAGAAGTSGARYSLFVTLRGGLGRLVDRLAGSLPPGGLRTGTPAAAVTRSGPGPEPWSVRTGTGDTLRAAAVVLALPASASARLLADLDPGLAAGLAAIPYGSVATVNLAYARGAIAHPLDGLGFVVPRSEGGTLVACTFSSVKFEGRAPADGVLLRAFAAAGDGAGTDPAALERETHAALARLLGITAPPRLSQVRVWRGAMPRYAVGHAARLAAIETRLADHPGLLLAGNGLRGVGLPDCVRGGERAAETVAAVAGWYPVRPAAAEGEAR